MNKIYFLFVALLFGCSGALDKTQVSKLLEENPEILTNAIEKNPVAIAKALDASMQKLRQEQQRERQLAAIRERDKYFSEPLKPRLSAEQIYLGNKNAKITIVEYTDFQCPFCARGANTMKEVIKKYGKDVRVTVKHLPLPFHKEARKAAEIFEAIRMQNAKAAFKYHDILFENQSAIREKGEKYLLQAAKKAGANMAELKRDVKTRAVKDKVDQDMAEASKFGIRGTPGFIINGVPVRGAVPITEFSTIIDRHLAKK